MLTPGLLLLTSGSSQHLLPGVEGWCMSGFPSWPVNALKVSLSSLCLVLSLAQGPAPRSSQWTRQSDASLVLQMSTVSRMAAHSVKKLVGHRPLFTPREVTPAPGFLRRAGLDCKAEADCDSITENLTYGIMKCNTGNWVVRGWQVRREPWRAWK